MAVLFTILNFVLNTIQCLYPDLFPSIGEAMKQAFIRISSNKNHSLIAEKTRIILISILVGIVIGENVCLLIIF
jgi:hypothetical protein